MIRSDYYTAWRAEVETTQKQRAEIKATQAAALDISQSISKLLKRAKVIRFNEKAQIVHIYKDPKDILVINTPIWSQL